MIDCIMPVAGLSSRMGQWKPILPLGSSTLIEIAVSNALKGGCKVILVVGYHCDKIIKLFEYTKDVEIVKNPNYQNGFLSSVKAGVKAVSTNYFFISLADMPFLYPEVYRELQKVKTNKIIFPACNGKPGHPVLIPIIYIDLILKHNTGKRIRPLLQSLPHIKIDGFSCDIHIDIDNQEDFIKATERFNPS